MKATNKTSPFVSPASPFLPQHPFSPTTSSLSRSPPNPPPRDHQLRLVLPAPTGHHHRSLLPRSAIVSALPSSISNVCNTSGNKTFVLVQQQEQNSYFPFQAPLPSDNLPQQHIQVQLQHQLLSSPQTLLPDWHPHSPHLPSYTPVSDRDASQAQDPIIKLGFSRRTLQDFQESKMHSCVTDCCGERANALIKPYKPFTLKI